MSRMDTYLDVGVDPGEENNVGNQCTTDPAVFDVDGVLMSPETSSADASPLYRGQQHPTIVWVEEQRLIIGKWE